MTTEKPLGLLFVSMDIPPALEDEFNRWYNTEHLAQLLGVPGFRTARRFVAVEGAPKYLALYDLDSVDVLKSEAYIYVHSGPGRTAWTNRMVGQAQNYQRKVCEQIFPPTAQTPPLPPNAKALLATMIDLTAPIEEEFNDWYNTEHLPALLSVPGFLRARRFVVVEGSPKYLALYDLEDVGVLQTETYFKARDSAWSRRIRARRNLIRNVYQQIYP